jgi:hypothetical protein
MDPALLLVCSWLYTFFLFSFFFPTSPSFTLLILSSLSCFFFPSYFYHFPPNPFFFFFFFPFFLFNHNHRSQGWICLSFLVNYRRLFSPFIVPSLLLAYFIPSVIWILGSFIPYLLCRLFSPSESQPLLQSLDRFICDLDFDDCATFSYNQVSFIFVIINYNGSFIQDSPLDRPGLTHHGDTTGTP